MQSSFFVEEKIQSEVGKEGFIEEEMEKEEPKRSEGRKQSI